MKIIPTFSDKQIRVFLLILYGFASFIGMYFHEPWRDEYLAYTFSYFSHNLSDLFKNTAYEGHPKLWFVVLYIIKQFSTSIFLIQVIHWLITLGSIYLLLFKSKIKKNFVYLIPFGYFFIYEYSAIFRNYAIGILFFFLSLTFYQSKKYYPFVFFLSLSLWSNVNCLIIGCCFFLFFIIQSNFKLDKKILVLSMYVFLNLIAIIVTTLRPKDAGFAHNISWNWTTAGHVLGKYTSVLFLYPENRIDAWNTSWFSIFKGPDFHYILKAISLLLLIYFSVYFYKKSKDILFFFLISTIGMYLFFVFVYVGFFRHIGFQLIIIIICLWLSGISINQTKKNETKKYIEFPIYLIFLFQIASGIYFIKSEYQNQFSQSKCVVSMLQKKDLDKNTILAEEDFNGVDFCALLKKPIFYCNLQKFGTFTIWDDKRYSINGSDSLVFANFNQMKRSVLINTSPVKDTFMTKLNYLGAFEPCICGDENYYVYFIKN